MLEEEQLVYWYSGLYLQPQHFQSVDLHHSFMLARYRQLSQPYNQGYYECSINERLLDEFTLRIDKIKAVLPSGYYLEYPGNCVVQDKCLSHLRDSDEISVNLWISLRRFNPGHANVSGLQDKRGVTRWISSDDEIIMRDIYHESPETGITRIKYDVQIITDEEKENSTDCEFLPLIRITRINNTMMIDQRYIFPALRLSAGYILKEKASEIYDELYSYKNKLEEIKYTGRSVSDSHIYSLLILCAINRTLPLLAFFLNDGSVHPCSYYMALRQLAGEITTFDSNNFSVLNERDLTYKHSDQMSCFNNIHDYLRMLLDIFCRDKIVRLNFNHIASGTLICCLDEYSEKNDSLCFIKLISDTFKNKALNTAALSEIKLAPAGHIDIIIQHALPGIPLTEIDAAAAGLPTRENIIWLEVDICSELWKKAKIQKRISLFWSCSPGDLLAELVLSPAGEI